MTQENKAREIKIQRYGLVTITRDGETWDDMRQSEGGNYVKVSDYEDAIEAEREKVRKLVGAIKSCVGFEPFNSLEPYKLSEALKEIEDI